MGQTDREGSPQATGSAGERRNRFSDGARRATAENWRGRSFLRRFGRHGIMG